MSKDLHKKLKDFQKHDTTFVNRYALLVFLIGFVIHNKKLYSVSIRYNSNRYITVVLTICEKLPKMKVCKKEWFCFQCSLQFDSSSVFHLHLRLLHKESIKIKVKGNEPYINESFESEGGFQEI